MHAQQCSLRVSVIPTAPWLNRPGESEVCAPPTTKSRELGRRRVVIGKWENHNDISRFWAGICAHLAAFSSITCSTPTSSYSIFMVQQNQQIEIRSDRLPFSEMTILRRSLARSHVRRRLLEKADAATDAYLLHNVNQFRSCILAVAYVTTTKIMCLGNLQLRVSGGERERSSKTWSSSLRMMIYLCFCILTQCQS